MKTKIHFYKKPIFITKKYTMLLLNLSKLLLFEILYSKLNESLNIYIFYKIYYIIIIKNKLLLLTKIYQNNYRFKILNY